MLVLLLATFWLCDLPWQMTVRAGWVVPRQIGRENTQGFRPRLRRGDYRGKR